MQKDIYIFLLEKAHSSDITAAEQKQLDEWLSVEKNQKAAEAYQKVLDLTNHQAEPTLEIDLDARFAEMQAKMQPKMVVEAKKPTKMIAMVRWAIGIAAVGLLLLFAKVGGVFSNDVANVSMIATAVEGDEVITLADGTLVHLKKGAHLTHFSEKNAAKRLVILKGEAFFEVKKNPDAPFVVEINGGTVTVLGTKFNVKNEDGAPNTTVLVEEGKVALANTKNEKVVLTALEKGALNHKTGNVSEEKVKNLNSAVWVKKTLVYENEPLTNVLKDVNALYDVEFVLENASLQSCPIDAMFKGDDFEACLDVFSKVFSFTIEVKSNKTYLLKGGTCD